MERNPRERNNGGTQWTEVKRRKPRNLQPSATKTCFVNHLPTSTNISDLAKIFRTHGAIANIHIPTIQKHSTHIYAFVQFYYPQSLQTAIRDEHKRMIGNKCISVFPAKQDKPGLIHTTMNLNPQPPSQKQNQSKVKNVQFTLRDNRSYKDAAQVTTFPIIKQTESNPEKNPKPTNSTTAKPNPTRHRIMSSRALGEETEKIRQSLGEIDLKSDYAAVLKGEKSEENVEWLERSAIAIAESSQTSESILDHILSEGVNCLTIKSMEGMQHLLIFDTFEDKKHLMESQWLPQWFSVVRNVNDESAALWRATWVTVYGVPLVAWGYQNFYNIGCILGRVISVEYK